MAEQVTKMVIKVDLQCRRCHKKIKKILSDIPQVTDQIFDEKKNTVTITVVGSNPEKIRQKICRKGRGFIIGIDIIPPKPPPPPKKPDTKEQSTQTPSDPTPVIGHPPVHVMGQVYVCPLCHNQGCGSFCPCNCHYKRPPMCNDGCGRPTHECRCGKLSMCQDGCGKLAHECICWKRPKCPDGCGKPAHECRCWKLPMCRDGCGRPAHECRCWRPIYPRCCDRYMYGYDYGRPLVCTRAGYECETSCSLM